MTKLKVYQPSDKGEEDTVYLKLEPGIDEVNLIAVNESGERRWRGDLLCLRGGRIYLRSSVDPDLGFDLDGIGCIKLTK